MTDTTRTHEFITSRCICCASPYLAKSPAILMPFVAHRVFGHEPLEILPEWGFRDLRPGMAYTLCNSLQCQKCGALFLDYRFTDDQMAALYGGYRDACYTRERDRYEPGYAATAAEDFKKRAAYIAEIERWLAPHLPERPTVLDWGGGDGINTPFLGSGGLVHVHDISAVPLVAGALPADPAQFGKRQYDLVVCSQVLEHIPFPHDFLAALLPVLSADTLLYLEVPHEPLMRDHPGSLDLAPRKHHWHEHINFFSTDSLSHLLARLDLQYVDSHVLPIDLGTRKGEVLGILARPTAARRK